MALVELSIMEQRYRAVIEIENGCPVTEVAARYGVSRQTVHTWKNRYQQGGLAALINHSLVGRRRLGGIERSHPLPSTLKFDLADVTR